MDIDSRGCDGDLVQRLKHGDEDAFTAIYEKHSGAVYRFALYVTGERLLAEEVTQEVFLFLLAGAGSYDASRGSLVAWLLGVARNESRRVLRGEGNEDALDDWQDYQVADDADVFEEFARQELLDAVKSAVRSLPTALREVVVLCELQELDYKEAAAVLACPVGTVRSRLNRARAMLLSKLKARCSA
jgi:RNA polymerase sigma-70 factor (ECF subfamily)